MALLNWGTEKRAGITFNAKAKWEKHKYSADITLPGESTLELLEAISSKLKIPSCKFVESETPCVIKVTRLELSKHSQCFYPELFSIEKDLIVLGVNWTYNGTGPEMFPLPESKDNWSYVDIAESNTRKLRSGSLEVFGPALSTGQFCSMIFLIELPRNQAKALKILNEVNRQLKQSDFFESVKIFPENINPGLANELETQRKDFALQLKQFLNSKKLDVLELFNGFFSPPETTENIRLVYNEDFLKLEVELKILSENSI